jgi:hypothetical protein
LGIERIFGPVSFTIEGQSALVSIPKTSETFQSGRTIQSPWPACELLPPFPAALAPDNCNRLLRQLMRIIKGHNQPLVDKKITDKITNKI